MIDGVDLKISHSLGRLREGFGFSVIQVLMRHSGQLVSTVLLARLLTPRDYGLVAMSATLITFLSFFLEMGLAWVTVQRTDLSREQLSNLFWVNSAIGTALWVASAAFAPLLAYFYHEPSLTWVVIAQGAMFPAMGLAVQPAAQLRRKLIFKSATWIEICTLVLGQVLSIVLAYAGAGYWALVIGLLAGHWLRAALFLFASGFRVSRFTPGSGTFGLVRSGGLIALAGFFFYFVRNLDDLLVGRFWGASELAFYSRAYFIVNVPAQVLAASFAGIAIPVIASASTASNKDEAAIAFRRSLRYFAWIITPLSLGLCLAADDVVAIVYGSRWERCVPILKWLALGGLAFPIFQSPGWLLVGSKRNREYLIFSIVSAVVLALAFGFGVHYGPIGVAIGFTIGVAGILAVPSLYYAHKVTGFPFARTMAELLPLAACASLMAVALATFSRLDFTRALSSHVRLMAEIAIGLTIIGTGYLLQAALERGNR